MQYNWRRKLDTDWTLYDDEIVNNNKKQKNLKQSWLPAFWKKIQNTKEIKRTLFNKTEQDKTCKFSM